MFKIYVFIVVHKHKEKYMKKMFKCIIDTYVNAQYICIYVSMSMYIYIYKYHLLDIKVHIHAHKHKEKRRMHKYIIMKNRQNIFLHTYAYIK